MRSMQVNADQHYCGAQPGPIGRVEAKMLSQGPMFSLIGRLEGLGLERKD